MTFDFNRLSRRKWAELVQMRQRATERDRPDLVDKVDALIIALTVTDWPGVTPQAVAELAVPDWLKLQADFADAFELWSDNLLRAVKGRLN